MLWNLLFGKEMVFELDLKVDDYFDWIDKTVEIFHIINKYDTIRNRMLYHIKGFMRSGLPVVYFQTYEYNDGWNKQTVRIKCREAAWNDLRRLDWVTHIQRV